MVKPILKLKMSFIDIKNMFNKIQTDNHNVKKSVTTKEKYILRKMSFMFQSTKVNTYATKHFIYIFVITFELFWSQEIMRSQWGHS